MPHSITKTLNAVSTSSLKAGESAKMSCNTLVKASSDCPPGCTASPLPSPKTRLQCQATSSLAKLPGMGGGQGGFAADGTPKTTTGARTSVVNTAPKPTATNDISAAGAETGAVLVTTQSTRVVTIKPTPTTASSSSLLNGSGGGSSTRTHSSLLSTSASSFPSTTVPQSSSTASPTTATSNPMPLPPHPKKPFIKTTSGWLTIFFILLFILAMTILGAWLLRRRKKRNVGRRKSDGEKVAADRKDVGDWNGGGAGVVRSAEQGVVNSGESGVVPVVGVRYSEMGVADAPVRGEGAAWKVVGRGGGGGDVAGEGKGKEAKTEVAKLEEPRIKEAKANDRSVETVEIPKSRVDEPGSLSDEEGLRSRMGGHAYSANQQPSKQPDPQPPVLTPAQTILSRKASGKKPAHATLDPNNLFPPPQPNALKNPKSVDPNNIIIPSTINPNALVPPPTPTAANPSTQSLPESQAWAPTHRAEIFNLLHTQPQRIQTQAYDPSHPRGPPIIPARSPARSKYPELFTSLGRPRSPDVPRSLRDKMPRKGKERADGEWVPPSEEEVANRAPTIASNQQIREKGRESWNDFDKGKVEGEWKKGRRAPVVVGNERIREIGEGKGKEREGFF